MWHAETKQILGTPNGLAWSQVHHFFPEEREKREKRGELILLVSIKGEASGQGLSNLGREIISRFHEEYFGNLDGKIMARLKEILLKLGEEKSEFFSGPKELCLLALIIWEKVAYLGIWNEGRVLLCRQGKVGILLNGEKNKAKIASGLVKENDLFFLATADFFDKIPEGMITACLAAGDLETITGDLTPAVHAKEKQGGLAAVALKIVAKTSNRSVKKKLSASVKFSLLGKYFTAIKKRILDITSNVLPKTSALTVAMGFLILLVFSVFFGWKKRIKQRKLARIAQLSSSIEQKLETAAAIRNLDPEETLKLAGETKEVIKELSQIDSAKAANYQARIDTLALGLGEKAVEPRLYYDLNLVGEGINTRTSFSDGKKLLVLDSEGKRLVQINLDKKSGEFAAGGEKLAEGKLVAFADKRIYLIGEKTISWLKNDEFQKTMELDEKDQIIDADSWLGGLYLLDKNKEQIWKYPAISAGLGRRRPWLKTEINFSFSQIVDMSINGNIWLLLGNGRIYKFLSGRPDKFNQRLPSGIGKAKFLAVARDAAVIAFWDEGKKTVWVFNKDGEFLSRIPVKIESVNGMSLAANGDKVYLLAGDKVYFLNFQ